MEIRGEEVLLPVSAVSAFPRPHWLQGRVFGSQYEPTYRSHNLRVAYEDACKLTAREQEAAGLHILCDGAQYYEWEAPGFQLEPIFHFIPEMLGGIDQLRPARRRREVQAVLQGHREREGRVGSADLRGRLLRHAARHRPPVQDRFPRSCPAERDPRRPALRRRRGAGQGHRPRAQQGDALPAGHGLRVRAAHRRAAALHHRHVADRVPADHVGGHQHDQVLAHLLRQRRRPARRVRQPRTGDDAAVPRSRPRTSSTWR